MHYLEGGFDSALGNVVHYLVPEHQYKSVHDFFNPQLFHAMMTAILQNIPDLLPHLDSLLSKAHPPQQEHMGSSSGFVEMRVRHFSSLWETMQMALALQGQEPRELPSENLLRMVKDYDLDDLEVMLQDLFQLLIQHHAAVEHITEIPSKDQTAIRDFLERGKLKAEVQGADLTAKHHFEEEQHKLQEENNELRNVLNTKQYDLQSAIHQKMELEDQLQQVREVEASREAQIDSLKRRLMAYEETDTLFQEKDEEIHRLSKTVAQLQLNNRLLSSDLATEKGKLEFRMRDLQQINSQLQIRTDRLTASLATLGKQKDQIQQSNKKVIANLKDKLKSQTERIGDIQSQMVEAKISRELRERQFSQLWSNYESLRTQSLLQGSSKGGPLQKRLSLAEIEKGLACSGQHRDFLRLGEQINELEKFQQNAFEEEIMMFESGQDNLKKVQEIINENARLKERLAALESKDYRAVLHENQRLKKRVGVMRRRNEELDTQRREELDLMVSTFHQCLHTHCEKPDL